MTKYRFNVSTMYIGSEVTEDFTAEDLGIEEDMSEEEIEDILEESYKDWSLDQIEGGWEIL